MPKHDAASTKDVADDEVPAKRGCRYWPWAALMARSFQIDVEKCPSCGLRLGHGDFTLALASPFVLAVR